MMTKRKETLALFCVGEEKSIRCRKGWNIQLREVQGDRQWPLRVEHTRVPSGSRTELMGLLEPWKFVWVELIM